MKSLVVHKFGGASVSSAEAVKNMAQILERKEFSISRQFVIVSAMGKTTNELELANQYLCENNQLAFGEKIKEIERYHLSIVKECPEEKESAEITQKIKAELHNIKSLKQSDKKKQYDAVVSVGETLSTLIITHYLTSKNLDFTWLDARAYIKTIDRSNSSEVDFNLTKQKLESLDLDQNYIIGGFIASCSTHTTTLGREGSDYTASIIAHCLNAKKVYIWKDVPGVLNADPKKFNNTIKIREMSYEDAVEISYYGASVIHPKTIQPLKNKGIPLFVKSFVQSEDPGTSIKDKSKIHGQMPACFIVKENQIYLSIIPKDFGFINEGHLEHIYRVFKENEIKLNLSQHSAVEFNACIDAVTVDIIDLFKEYHLKVQNDLKLITVTYFNETIINELIGKSKVLLSQRTNHIARIVTGI